MACSQAVGGSTRQHVTWDVDNPLVALTPDEMFNQRIDYVWLRTGTFTVHEAQLVGQGRPQVHSARTMLVLVKA